MIFVFVPAIPVVPEHSIGDGAHAPVPAAGGVGLHRAARQADQVRRRTRA